MIKVLLPLICFFSFGQTEFLEYADSADFSYVNYNLMKKNNLTTYKVYEIVNDSSILFEINTLNFSDSTNTRKFYDVRKKKWSKPETIPMYDDYSPIDSTIITESYTSVPIFDQYHRLIQHNISYPYSAGGATMERHFGYLDTTHYLSFEIVTNSKMNRFQTSTTIIQYEYGVSACSGAGLFCYFRKEFKREEGDACFYLAKENYINELGLLMTSWHYTKDERRFIYGYEYE